MIIIPDVDCILELHDSILFETGGLHGIRDKSLLMSLVKLPLTTMYGVDLYKTDEEKIAIMVYSVIAGHIFIDANKRTGIQLLTIMCDINNIIIEYKNAELSILALNVAKGAWNNKDIEFWIQQHKQI